MEKEKLMEELRPKLQEEAKKIAEDMVEDIADQQPVDVSVSKDDVEKLDLPDRVDHEKFAKFMERPFLVNKVGEADYEVIVPAWHNLEVGRFKGTTPEGHYKVFAVNNTTKALHGIPPELRNDPRIELDFEENLKVKGNWLYFNDATPSAVTEDPEIEKHLEEIQEDRAKIKPGHEFELLKVLFEKGEQPFTPESVDDEDLRPSETEFPFDLRSYQNNWVEKFLNEGHACFCGPTGSGKSIPALEILDRLRYDLVDARKAIIVEGRMTRDQWKTYIERWAPRLADEVDIVTYASVDKLQPGPEENFEYIAVVADECHALPADTFAGAATLPMKYRLGLSASPYREDDKTPYIFALTGPPTGMNWDEILEEQGKERHEIRIHVVKDRDHKTKRVKDISDEVITEQGKRTLVFCDGIDYGEELQTNLGLDFVNGDDTEQYQKVKGALEDDNACVISRVGDHGLSVDGLEAIIEADFLFGSRRQQIQRTGRLLHGHEGARHDIVFTEDEFENYKKRLYSLMDNDFEFTMVDDGYELEKPDDFDDRNYDIEIEESEGADKELYDAKAKARNMSEIEMLKQDVVQKEIEERLEDLDRSTKKGKKALLHLAKTDDDFLSSEELSQLLDYGESSVRKIMSELFSPPNIVVKHKETSGRGTKGYSINTDALDRIIDKHQKRKDVDEDFEEVFGE